MWALLESEFVELLLLLLDVGVVGTGVVADWELLCDGLTTVV